MILGILNEEHGGVPDYNPDIYSDKDRGRHECQAWVPPVNIPEYQRAQEDAGYLEHKKSWLTHQVQQEGIGLCTKVKLDEEVG